jgi:hypothetical protein
MMLRIFLGSEPEGLLEARLEWHRAKLAELEGYLKATRKAAREDAPGVERSLVGGTLYHRTQLEAYSQLLDSYQRAK